MTNSYYAHPSAVIDDNVKIGESTKIWHFVHVCSGAHIGSACVIGTKRHDWQRCLFFGSVRHSLSRIII